MATRPEFDPFSSAQSKTVSEVSTSVEPIVGTIAPVLEKRVFKEDELDLFDDRYLSSVTNFSLEPNIILQHMRSIVVYAEAANTESVHICFSRESARARKFVTLAAGGSVSIAAPDSKETFTMLAWVKNATTTATQGVYIFGLRRRKEPQEPVKPSE